MPCALLAWARVARPGPGPHPTRAPERTSSRGRRRPLPPVLTPRGQRDTPPQPGRSQRTDFSLTNPCVGPRAPLPTRPSRLGHARPSGWGPAVCGPLSAPRDGAPEGGRVGILLRPPGGAHSPVGASPAMSRCLWPFSFTVVFSSVFWGNFSRFSLDRGSSLHTAAFAVGSPLVLLFHFLKVLPLLCLREPGRRGENGGTAGTCSGSPPSGATSTRVCACACVSMCMCVCMCTCMCTCTCVCMREHVCVYACVCV